MNYSRLIGSCKVITARGDVFPVAFEQLWYAALVKPEEEFMKTLLVPLDGSALAERILPHVRLVAALLAARVHFLHVIVDDERMAMLASDYAVVSDLAGPQAAERVREQRLVSLRQQHAQRYLGAQVELFHDAGLMVDVDIQIGVPADCIVAMAQEYQVDLIAMATHGYGGLRRWAVGSVTDQVVRTTTVPVLVVRDAEHTAALRPQLRRLLVPLDGSALAEQALPVATGLAAQAGAEVVLLRAISPIVEAYSPLSAGMQLLVRDQAQQELAIQAGALQPAPCATEVVVMTGAAAEAIVEGALLSKADLIVMATHGYGGLRRLALGSVADTVLRTTTTPLLLVRACA